MGRLDFGAFETEMVEGRPAGCVQYSGIWGAVGGEPGGKIASELSHAVCDLTCLDAV